MLIDDQPNFVLLPTEGGQMGVAASAPTSQSRAAGRAKFGANLRESFAKRAEHFRTFAFFRPRPREAAGGGPKTDSL